MNMVDIGTLAKGHPQALGFDPSELGLIGGPIIDSSAAFATDCKIGKVAGIGAVCAIGSEVVVGNQVDLADEVHLLRGVVLGDNVSVGHESVLDRGVCLSSDLVLGASAYLGPGSSVAPRYKRIDLVHPYERKIFNNLMLGGGIVLPSEVQLGNHAVIPTQECIAEIGRFGKYKRNITIYGSNRGALFGVGCQYGIDTKTFRQRVAEGKGTVASSAADYAKHLPEIEALALKVQAAYEQEDNLIGELLDQRKQAFAEAGLA